MDSLILIIDNYDSFTYNLMNTLADLGAKSIVVRNDEITARGVERIGPDRIIISPGPGNPLRPRDVRVSADIVRSLGWRIPILGVCLGHQLIGVLFGANLRPAKRILHGKQSTIRHFGGKLYRELPREFSAMRYHSLVIDDVKEPLKVEAICLEDEEVMGIRHHECPIHGVQFHPESIGTARGRQVLKNFLDDPW